MAKSKTRFDVPTKWTPHAQSVMRADAEGSWVRMEDYRKLLAAYKGALCQLDRAGKRIAGLVGVPNGSN